MTYIHWAFNIFHFSFSAISYVPLKRNEFGHPHRYHVNLRKLCNTCCARHVLAPSGSVPDRGKGRGFAVTRVFASILHFLCFSRDSVGTRSFFPSPMGGFKHLSLMGRLNFGNGVRVLYRLASQPSCTKSAVQQACSTPCKKPDRITTIP